MSIARWPYRRIRYLQDKILVLHETVGFRDHDKVNAKIQELEDEINKIMLNGKTITKTPQQTKVTGVVKRGRPKLYHEKHEKYDSSMHLQQMEESEEDFEGSICEKSFACHLLLDVNEIVNILHHQ
jgi:hypothetical protein